MMRKATVTGASGHLGANLVRLLIKRGYRVTALVRKSSEALADLDISIIEGDITCPDSLDAAFAGAEQVYHLAAHISIADGEWEKLRTINVEGTQNVLTACQSQGVSTLVHFSSIHALDLRPLDRPVSENNPLVKDRMPHGSDYDFSKAEADRLIRKNDCSHLDTRIIYPTAVFGPHDYRMSLFGQAILKMANGRLPALVAGGFDWVDARDVVTLAVDAAEKGRDGDRFIVSGHYRDMRQVAAVISELTGISAPRLSSPIWLARLFAPLMSAWASLQDETPLYTKDSLSTLNTNRMLSHDRAAGVLGYKPQAFRASMRDTLRFYAGRNLVKLKDDGF